MGEFAKVIQPHLDAQGIEGPEGLASELKKAGVDREASEVRRWMSGDPGDAGAVDLAAMTRALGLGDEAARDVCDAFVRDARAQTALL